MLCDHDPLHFARAFADLADLRVSEMALHRELARVAVASVNLEGAIARSRCGFARVELRHRCFAAVRLALIAEPRRAVDEELRCVELGLRVREHPLDRLELRDGLSELLAVLRIRD